MRDEHAQFFLVKTAQKVSKMKVSARVVHSCTVKQKKWQNKFFSVPWENLKFLRTKVFQTECEKSYNFGLLNMQNEALKFFFLKFS